MLAPLLAFLLQHSAAHAQGNDAPQSASLQQRSDRMGETLARMAAAEHWSGGDTALRLGTGAVLIGVGGYFAFSREHDEGQGTSRGFAVALSVLGGAGLFARGVYALGGVTTEAEARLARFERDRRAGALSELELARFEAQLELEAANARAQRRWGGVGNIGVAAAGAGLMVLGATSRLRGPARDVMYYEGGGLFAFGTGFAIYDFARESKTEREWRDYRSATAVQASQLRLELAPNLAPHLAGLSLIGRF
jgi:hypothetical protein